MYAYNAYNLAYNRKAFYAERFAQVRARQLAPSRAVSGAALEQPLEQPLVSVLNVLLHKRLLRRGQCSAHESASDVNSL